jgi:hypothetical protein
MIEESHVISQADVRVQRLYFLLFAGLVINARVHLREYLHVYQPTTTVR